MTISFAGKVAIVTGAGSGVGRAVALAKKILLGEKFEKDIIEPTVVVTQDNVAEYLNDAY